MPVYPTVARKESGTDTALSGNLEQAVHEVDLIANALLARMRRISKHLIVAVAAFTVCGRILVQRAMACLNPLETLDR